MIAFCGTAEVRGWWGRRYRQRGGAIAGATAGRAARAIDRSLSRPRSIVTAVVSRFIHFQLAVSGGGRIRRAKMRDGRAETRACGRPARIRRQSRMEKRAQSTNLGAAETEAALELGVDHAAAARDVLLVVRDVLVHAFPAGHLHLHAVALAELVRDGAELVPGDLADGADLSEGSGVRGEIVSARDGAGGDSGDARVSSSSRVWEKKQQKRGEIDARRTRRRERAIA